MKSPGERKAELTEKVESLATAYLELMRNIQDQAVVMATHNRLHGAYPPGSEQSLRALHDKSLRVRVRLLRTRALMIEVDITSSFGDAPTIAPNQLPEDW